MTAKRISVYGDGSSGGAAGGAIGWGYLVTDWCEILSAGSGAELTGTNNVAEIKGLMDGLQFVVDNNLHVGNTVELVSDSTYALGCASGAFCALKNLELVAKIRALTIITKAKTRWIRGHSGDLFNEKCDQLAKHARDKISPDKGLKRRHKRREVRRAKRALVKAFKRGELFREPLRF